MVYIEYELYREGMVLSMVYIEKVWFIQRGYTLRICPCWAYITQKCIDVVLQTVNMCCCRGGVVVTVRDAAIGAGAWRSGCSVILGEW